MAETIEAGETRFFDGRTLPVDPTQIEAALRQLWTDEQQQDRSVVRACVLNLVVYAGSDNETAQAAEVISQLTVTYPCRALVLNADEAAEQNNLQAWLSAHCQMPRPNGQRICCEQVTLAATGEAVERLPSAILPLLVPDLPVVLWWIGEPAFGSPLFDALIDVADRLVVDTRTFQDPSFSLAQLAQVVRFSSDRIAVDDLNWARLRPWQEQLAQVFDSQETLPFLQQLERLSVVYARRSGSGWSEPEQALLLTGWLLNQTGWEQLRPLTRVASGHFRGRLRRAGAELVVEILPDDLAASDASGMLLSVELRGIDEGRTATIHIDRRRDALEALTTHIQVGDRDPLTVTRILETSATALLLADSLSHFDHDPLFEAALESAALLSGGSQRRLR